MGGLGVVLGRLGAVLGHLGASWGGLGAAGGAENVDFASFFNGFAKPMF